MKTYVTDLQPNTEATSHFMVAETQIRKTKFDKPYLVMKLVDKTGQIDGRMWDIPKELDVTTIKRGSVVKVQADVSEWNGGNQLTIRKIRIIEEGQLFGDEVRAEDFLESSENDPDKMWQELMDRLDRMEDGHLRLLVSNILTNNREKFCKAPAGKSVHHCYLGGLLEHSLSMCEVAVLVAKKYGLDRDLLLAGCVLHDIGKVNELSYEWVLGYTVEGTLVGHISQGMIMVSQHMDQIKDFPKKLRIALMHLIASHHGLLEYGSPKVPLTKEAIAFNLIDLLDSKLAICDRAFKKGIDADGLTEWSRELGGPLWKWPS